MLKYIFSIGIVILAWSNLSAQVSRYAPTAVRIGADPGTLAYMIFSEKRGFFEIEADTDIDRFFLVANYGVSNYLLDEPTYRYENNGSYLRFGADINFMHKDPNLNVMFFGLRYATSSFNDQLDFDTDAVIQSQTGWPNTRQTISNGNAKANWHEVVAGTKDSSSQATLSWIYTSFQSSHADQSDGVSSTLLHSRIWQECQLVCLRI